MYICPYTAGFMCMYVWTVCMYIVCIYVHCTCMYVYTVPHVHVCMLDFILLAAHTLEVY